METIHGKPVDRSLARPFVKWAGGKGQVLADLLSRMPARYDRYFEPFLGGGAPFFASCHEEAFLSDRNPFLINAYSVVRDRFDDLAESLARHRPDRDYYYAMREADPATFSDVERASWFIYLNKTCYNGLWRVNSRGKYNVPYGRYKNPRILDAENLRRASHALRGATIACQDFEDALQGAREGDFVYADPPYYPLSETAGFTGYVEGGFGLGEQVRLAEAVRRLTNAGVMVMLSNSDTAPVWGLYSGFKIETVQVKRSINSRGDRRGPVSELIVRNY